MPAPKAIAFDVIETVFSLDPLRDRFAAAGRARGDLEPFFAAVLRDAFALDTCGIQKPFKEIALSVLGVMGLSDREAEDILGGFRELSAYDDVAPTLRWLKERDVNVMFLTNGDPEITKHLVDKNGLSFGVDKILTVSEIGRWKPAERVYHAGAEAMGVEPGEMALVACHGWDVQGAMAAGLKGAYVRREGRPYPAAMAPATAVGDTLPEAVEALF